MFSLLVGTDDKPHSIIERFDGFEARYARSQAASDLVRHLEEVVHILSTIPSRDRFRLTLEIGGDSKTISAATEFDTLVEHVGAFHDEEEAATLRIEIQKSVERQTLSVYSLTALGTYLEAAPLSEVLSALVKRHEGRLIFDCLIDSPGYGTQSLVFVRKKEDLPIREFSAEERRRSQSILKANTHTSKIVGGLLPQDFLVASPVGFPSVDKFLARAGAAVSAMCLSNVSQITGNQIDYQINGYKLLAGSVESAEKLVDEEGSLVRLAEWACGSEGSSDKLGLARNVITLCTERLEDLLGRQEIWDAVQSNYQIYLKENISTYLEVRNKLAELLSETTHKTHALAESLLDSVRNAILIVLSFVLSVVVINGIKDTSAQAIFSSIYLAIVIALLVLTTVAVFASGADALSRFSQSAAATSNLLKRMYVHVIVPAEIEQQVEPTIRENRAYLERQICKYQWFWVIFALLVTALFVAGYFSFGRQVSKTPDTTNSPPATTERVPPALTTLPMPENSLRTEAQSSSPAPSEAEREVSTKERSQEVPETDSPSVQQSAETETSDPSRESPAHSESNSSNLGREN
ncbi:MAG: hypothetical protein ACWGIK_02585 [Achromobacter pulmonis]